MNCTVATEHRRAASFGFSYRRGRCATSTATDARRGRPVHAAFPQWRAYAGSPARARASWHGIGSVANMTSGAPLSRRDGRRHASASSTASKRSHAPACAFDRHRADRRWRQQRRSGAGWWPTCSTCRSHVPQQAEGAAFGAALQALVGQCGAQRVRTCPSASVWSPNTSPWIPARVSVMPDPSQRSRPTTCRLSADSSSTSMRWRRSIAA